MKSFKVLAALALGLVLCLPGGALAAGEDVQLLRQEMKLLKARLAELEKKLEAAHGKANKAEREAKEAIEKAREAHAGSLKVSRDLAKMPKPSGGFLTELNKRVSVSGAVEFEFAYENRKVKGGKDTTTSGFSLATAEIIFNAAINKYTTGVIHFIWEDGDSNVRLDEAFVTLGQTDDMPFYAMGGLIYAPIGLFDTHLVSDPITLNVFETNVAALELGYSSGLFKVSLGSYNSDTQEASDSDDVINAFYARLDFMPKLGPIESQFGLAYTSNVAGGNGLGDWVNNGTLASLVGAWSAMASLKGKKWALTAEYIRVADSFEPGELTIADAADKPEPWALNAEAAFFPTERWTIAARYEASGDLYGEEPESQYGAAVKYRILSDTTLALEYLYGDYQNGDERHLITSQLAVAF